jgi:putative methionine-R-sulfoxide reductase with GAF domain
MRFCLAALLPSVRCNRNVVSIDWLGLYLAVVSGPYACGFCSRATLQGTDVVRGVRAHCGRLECFSKAMDEQETA